MRQTMFVIAMDGNGRLAAAHFQMTHGWNYMDVSNKGDFFPTSYFQIDLNDDDNHRSFLYSPPLLSLWDWRDHVRAAFRKFWGSEDEFGGV